MKTKFPKRNSDGTFSVDVCFVASSGMDVSEVEEWLAAWGSENQEWVRNWQGAGGKIIETEILRLDTAFRREPYLVPSAESLVIVRLDGTIEAPYWRDWAAELVKGLMAQFPFLEFKTVRNAE